MPDPFTRRVGASPDVVAVAPGRVNVIGEHTDYNEGLVLPMALPLAARTAARRRDDGLLRIWSRQQPGDVAQVALADLRPGAVTGWAAYVAGAVWAARRLVGASDVPGADLVVDSDVPVGAGLSSSAAVGCSVALAVTALAGVEVPPADLAVASQRAENDFVGVPTGCMDQMASMLGRAGHVVFLDTRTLDAELVPFDVATHGLALLVVDTRTSRALAHGAYAERRRTCEQAARALGVPALRDLAPADLHGPAFGRLGPTARRRVRHVVTENQRVLDVVAMLASGGTAGIGPALTASHLSLRDDYEVSSAELDLVVDTALDGGALGARMTGAGFGGSAIALVHVDRVDALTGAVTRAFADRGWDEPRCFVAVPAAGAHLEG